MSPFPILWMKRRLEVRKIIQKGDCIVGIMVSDAQVSLVEPSMFYDVLRVVSHRIRVAL